MLAHCSRSARYPLSLYDGHPAHFGGYKVKALTLTTSDFRQFSRSSWLQCAQPRHPTPILYRTASQHLSNKRLRQQGHGLDPKKSWTISQCHGASQHELSSEMTAGEGARQEFPDISTSDISDLLSSSSRVHELPAMDLIQNHPVDLRGNPVMKAEPEKAKTQSPSRESANLYHQVINKRRSQMY